MENYTTGPENGAQEDERGSNEHDYWGPHGREAMHYWKKMAWKKMKMAQKHAALCEENEDEDEAESQMYLWKKVGVAAAIAFVVGMLIGKKTRKE
jgi:hypothetical protein